MKIGILASHPIQYQAPLFKELARHCELMVFFAHRQDAASQAAAGFGVAFEWDVDLLAGYPSQFLENRARKPDASSFFGCNTPALADHIAQQRFDTFVVTGWHLWSYWQAVMACRRHGIPVLVRGDSQLATVRSPLKRVAKALLYPLLLKNFAGCLYVGEKNRAYLQHYHVPKARQFFAPHCVDTHWFAERAARSNRSAMRQQWGIAADAKVVLFAGKLLPRKRPQDLLQALQLLVTRGVAATGVLVGDGPMRQQLEQQAAAAKLDSRFAGFRNQGELSAYYAMADVLVLPSDASETWGLVVNEAIACGTPAIVADSVGCAGDLANTGAGWVFPMGDCAALANQLEQVLNNPPTKAALARWSSTYSIEATAAGILQACRAVAQRTA